MTCGAGRHPHAVTASPSYSLTSHGARRVESIREGVREADATENHFL